MLGCHINKFVLSNISEGNLVITEFLQPQAISLIFNRFATSKCSHKVINN